MDTPLTDAEIREALTRAERATSGPLPKILRTEECAAGSRYAVGVHAGEVLFKDRAAFAAEIAHRWNVYADLLAARAERDLALSLRNTATNVLADIVAHRDSLAARCLELEGFVRDFLHTTSGKKSLDGAPLSRLESAAQALLSPPSPHTCQIHRATSGASDCGLSPCEEATVHRDRGASRLEPEVALRPEQYPGEWCDVMHDHDGACNRRPEATLVEKHGPYCPKNPNATIRHMVDFCTCRPIPAETVTHEEAEDRALDTIIAASLGSEVAQKSLSALEAPEAAKCATCDGQVLGSPDEQGEPFVPTDRPCPDCGGGA